MREMPTVKPSHDVRINRVKMRDMPALYFRMTGAKAARRTILHWMREGRKSYSGVTIKLGHTVVMGRYYSTKAQLREFINEVRT